MIFPESSPFKAQALSDDITFKPVMSTDGPDPDMDIEKFSEIAATRIMITNATKTMTPATPPGERLHPGLGPRSVMITVAGLG